MRRILETDLALTTVLPDEEQFERLLKMARGRSPYSYSPSRSRSDILNTQIGEFGKLRRAAWPDLEREIRRHCARLNFKYPEKGLAANLSVSEGLYNFVTRKDVVGARRDFTGLQLGSLGSITYWSPVVLTIENQLVVPFFDFRRKERLNSEGMRFTFSVMNEHIRTEFRKLTKVRMAVVQFELNQIGPRSPVFHYDDGVELFDFDDIAAMVQRTYEIFAEVREKVRKDGSEPEAGNIGPLFDRAI